MKKAVRRISSKIRNKDERVFLITAASFAFNTLYALYNLVLGLWGKSAWFIIIFLYYSNLGIMRFLALREKNTESEKAELKLMRRVGTLLLLSAFILSLTTYLTLHYKLFKSYHEAVMISIATYTFIKLVFAIRNIIKAERSHNTLVITVRNINLSGAMVSLLNLQISMYYTFGGDYSLLLHGITGGVVCTLIIIIGGYTTCYSAKRLKNL